jgi:hypothetical protein
MIIILRYMSKKGKFNLRTAITTRQQAENTGAGSISALLSPSSEWRAKLAALAVLAARLAFTLAVAASPWRYRALLLERPLPPVYGDYTNFLLFAPDRLLLAALALWGLSLALQPRRISLGPLFVTLPLTGLTLAGLASVPNSVDPGLSAYHGARLLALGAFYLFCVNEIRSLKELFFAAGLLVLTQGTVGIAQVLAQSSLGLQRWGEYALDPAWSGVSIVWSESLRSLRAYGLSDHPNILGGCLAFSLLLLAAGYTLQASTRWRPLLGGLFGLGSLALLLTYSRSAWLAFLAGMLFLGGALYKTARREEALQWLALSGGVLILLLPFLLYSAPYLAPRLGISEAASEAPGTQQSLGERALLNGWANELFASRPLTGVGLGAFPTALQERHPDLGLNYQPAHLVLLDVAAETGLIGAAFFALLLAAPWVALYLRRKRLSFSPFLIAASALLLAVSLVGLFDYYTWLLVPGRMWSWLAWGVWAAAYRSDLDAGRPV